MIIISYLGKERKGWAGATGEMRWDGMVGVIIWSDTEVKSLTQLCLRFEGSEI